MNETTKESLKYGRKSKVIDESESPVMRKRMDIMRIIENRNNEPKITEQEEFDQLFKSI